MLIRPTLPSTLLLSIFNTSPEKQLAGQKCVNWWSHGPLICSPQLEQALRPGGVFSFGPMKYALSLQMGSRQTYQRPPLPDVTEEQKAKIQEGLHQIKEMA